MACVKRLSHFFSAKILYLSASVNWLHNSHTQSLIKKLLSFFPSKFLTLTSSKVTNKKTTKSCNILMGTSFSENRLSLFPCHTNILWASLSAHACCLRLVATVPHIWWVKIMIFVQKRKKYKYNNKKTIAATTRTNDICVAAQIGNCHPNHALSVWRGKCGHNTKCCLIEFQFR